MTRPQPPETAEEQPWRSLGAVREAMRQLCRDLLAWEVEVRGVWDVDTAIDEVERQVRVKAEAAVEDALNAAYTERLAAREAR